MKWPPKPRGMRWSVWKQICRARPHVPGKKEEVVRVKQAVRKMQRIDELYRKTVEH